VSSKVDFSGLRWRKSRHSNGQGSCVEVAALWRKSRHSNGSGHCVEVTQHRRSGGDVAVRDSKNPDGPKLVFSPAQWRAFTTAIKTSR
jgi:hypothetical protein